MSGMKYRLLICLCCHLGYVVAKAETFTSLRGDTLRYDGQCVILDESNFYVDSAISDEDISSPYVFKSFNEAAAHVKDGCAEKPMSIYMAPGVYWVDNPDDPEIRRPLHGTTPYGLSMKCHYLRIIGITGSPEDVVLACNRGQTQGADGNFTMLHLIGDDVSVSSVTFGNYCNVDLIYPRDTTLNRLKRMDAIVQAQLVHCQGDRYFLDNCRFISRLNLCPFTGARRTLFRKCYFECTDDALCGTGVYVDCDFTFFSSKPFYSTSTTGAVFLGCRINCLTQGQQYLTKANNAPVTLIDTDFSCSDDSLYLSWSQSPADNVRCYQHNVTLNGRSCLISSRKPETTVDMQGKSVLNAYILSESPKIYNIYNLVSGDDAWDPLGQCQDVELRSRSSDYMKLPILLTVSPNQVEIEREVSEAVLHADWRRFGDYPAVVDSLTWAVQDEQDSIVKLYPSADGRSCRVVPVIDGDSLRKVVVEAHAASGLQAASVVLVKPKTLPSPHFIEFPEIEIGKGKVVVDYTIDIGARRDESVVTWYRCADASGSSPIPIAVSRQSEPLREYLLTVGDIGWYIMAKVEPKHIRSLTGESVSITTTRVITSEDIVGREAIETDFSHFPTDVQKQIIPGFWTVDAYKPLDTQEYQWEPIADGAWIYARGTNGASLHEGLLQGKRGARLLYTPVTDSIKNMSLSLVVDPAKTAGQGFGSATGQYMDIGIHMDTQHLTGYALRIVRTAIHDKAVSFMLVRYENGHVEPLTSAVVSSCYRTTCMIHLWTENGRLRAHAETSAPDQFDKRSGVKEEVDLDILLPSGYNQSGGVMIQHTGSTGDSATQVRFLKVDWL